MGKVSDEHIPGSAGFEPHGGVRQERKIFGDKHYFDGLAGFPFRRHHESRALRSKGAACLS
jgi:hypothetical protein